MKKWNNYKLSIMLIVLLVLTAVFASPVLGEGGEETTLMEDLDDMLIIGGKGFTIDYIRDYREDASAAIATALIADSDNLFLWSGRNLLNIRTKESNVPADFDWVKDHLQGYYDKEGDWVDVEPEPDPDPDPDPEDKVVQETQAVSVEVAYGTYLVDILFPDTVVSTVNGETMDLEVDWDTDSTPPYDGNEAGDYVFEGTLLNLPAGVTNPDNVKAIATVTVLKALECLADVTAEVQEFQGYWFYDIAGTNVSGEAITVQATIDGTTISKAVGTGESFLIEIATITEYDTATVTAYDADDNPLQTVTVNIVKR